MENKLRRILPHVAIVLCNMYIVFFCIDRVNTAMQFINNSITKALLLILCVISTINASFLILDERRKIASQDRRRSAADARTATSTRVSPGKPATRALHTGQVSRSTAAGSSAAHSALAQQRKTSYPASRRDTAR